MNQFTILNLLCCCVCVLYWHWMQMENKFNQFFFHSYRFISFFFFLLKMSQYLFRFLTILPVNKLKIIRRRRKKKPFHGIKWICLKPLKLTLNGTLFQNFSFFIFVVCTDVPNRFIHECFINMFRNSTGDTRRQSHCG